MMKIMKNLLNDRFFLGTLIISISQLLKPLVDIFYENRVVYFLGTCFIYILIFGAYYNFALDFTKDANKTRIVKNGIIFFGLLFLLYQLMLRIL